MANFLPLLLLALFPLLSLAQAQETESPRALLLQAFETSAKASYITKNNIRFLEFPQASKGTYYKRTNPDGTACRRLDLTENGEILLSLLQNEDGHFILDHELGKTARSGALLRLYELEGIYLRPFEKEFDFCDFRMREVVFRNRPVWEITATLSREKQKDSPLLLSQITGCCEPDEGFEEQHPMTRSWLVDKRTHMLLQKRSITEDPKNITTEAMEIPDFLPDWSQHPTLFQTPKTVDFTVRNLQEYLEKRTTLLQERRKSQSHRLSASLRRILLVAVPALLGLLFLGAACALRRRE
ncbi:MAG: hypothetical protein ACI4SG_09240 [Oligosphaeraceae bacterium]